MNQIEWKEEYSVGHNVIDAQHKRIIRMINELIANQEVSIHSEFISDLLNDIVKYGMEHFMVEEMLMKEYEYPFLDEHHKEHLQFKLNGAVMCKKVFDNNETVPRELLEYLKKWWLDHILKEDLKLKYLFEKK
ncbi:hypothetical protein EMN47_18870 [Prolixibacteraceae bacterium JC049]|nr:hypothetical protein [Prolixibacteraceae bacterium JC049]